jgi:hypothetical protein
MGADSARRMGQMIPFPDARARPPRRPLAIGEPRGEVLLFTGVRYERLPEPAFEPAPEPSPLLSNGQARGGRRRRRS